MSQSLVQRSTLSDRTVAAGREVMAGRRRGLRALLPFAGPAVIASIAYMDPGNFATNIQAGAQFGYLLLWVVVLARTSSPCCSRRCRPSSASSPAKASRS